MEYYTFDFFSYKILIPRRVDDLRVVFIELTTRCNLNCEMCFKRYWKDSEGDMDERTFFKILDDLSEFPNVDVVVFGGIGEPFMHPRIMEFIQEVKSRGYRLAITTNGTFISEDLALKIIDAGVDTLYFSVDTIPGRETILGHVEFERTIEAIRTLQELKQRLKSKRPLIGIEFVITTDNYKIIPEAMDYFRELGVDSLILSNIIPMSEDHADKIVYDEEHSHDVEKVLSDPRVLKNTHYYRVLLPNFRPHVERHCRFVESGATVIRHDGEVCPCYRLSHNYVEYIMGRRKEVIMYSFGNVMERSLREIWTSKEYSLFRYKVLTGLYPSCIDCKLRDFCDFAKSTSVDCWSNVPSCSECLWYHEIVTCPVPRRMYEDVL
ncbi:MAG: tungsten cofactor oxidoreductase radical SAM maturase [Thermoplasmata archaeon]|nr:MAG: tungsten cofactor oxidoreductase radical SAM maturase [Thermoplasmata archaeon]